MKLDSRTKELIAVGASVTANCQPCLEYHVGKARQYGVDGDEIAQAIDVGRTVRKGAADKYDKFVASIDLAAAAPSSEAGCGCGSAEPSQAASKA
jgi:AhpD family alkylhydroperoxidase